MVAPVHYDQRINLKYNIIVDLPSHKNEARKKHNIITEWCFENIQGPWSGGIPTHVNDQKRISIFKFERKEDLALFVLFKEIWNDA